MVIINACLVDHVDEAIDETEIPCLLHFDSSSLHNKKNISENLWLWLNVEWTKKKNRIINILSVLTMGSFSVPGKWVVYENCGIKIISLKRCLIVCFPQNFSCSTDKQLWLWHLSLSICKSIVFTTLSFITYAALYHIKTCISWCDSTARFRFIIFLEANITGTKSECSANGSGKIMSPYTATSGGASGEASIPYTATASFMCATAAGGESTALSPIH